MEPLDVVCVAVTLKTNREVWYAESYHHKPVGDAGIKALQTLVASWLAMDLPPLVDSNYPWAVNIASASYTMKGPQAFAMRKALAQRALLATSPFTWVPINGSEPVLEEGGLDGKGTR